MPSGRQRRRRHRVLRLDAHAAADEARGVVERVELPVETRRGHLERVSVGDLVGRVEHGRGLPRDTRRSPRPSRRRRPGARARAAGRCSGPPPPIRRPAGGTLFLRRSRRFLGVVFSLKGVFIEQKSGPEPAFLQTATLYQKVASEAPQRGSPGARTVRLEGRISDGGWLPVVASARLSASAQAALARSAGEQGRDGQREEGRRPCAAVPPRNPRTSP